MPRNGIYGEGECFTTEKDNHAALEDSINGLSAYGKFMIERMFRTADDDFFQWNTYDWNMFSYFLIGGDQDIDKFCAQPKVSCKGSEIRLVLLARQLSRIQLTLW